MPIKFLVILMTFISLNANAEEECIFNEAAYTDFIHQYVTENKNASIQSDQKTLVVKRTNEHIVVQGGGCTHLGVSIDFKSDRTFSEEEFLSKTLMLSREFGGWLININDLENSIKNRDYQIIDGIYFIKVDAMTVFSASFNDEGEITVEFYIN